MTRAQQRRFVCKVNFEYKSEKITEWGTQNSTPVRRITLDPYRLASHKHEVIRSTPEADGIAPLYSDSQWKAGCVPSGPFFFFHICPLQTVQKPLAQQICCIVQLIQPTFIPLFYHFSPFFAFSFFATSSVSLPSFPMDLLGTLHIQRQRVMWLELDR